ncbi:MAG: carbohydrate porin [Verrucomicrobia bacterium]|nr:MAG: carbohydrate porin [Verrucomicrobiota bacterium]
MICLGSKLDFGCAIGFVLASISGALAQDTIPISRTNRSILQPEMEAQVQQPGFTPDDYMTGDWGGLRARLFKAGVEVFAFENSIYNGNVSGGIHPGHATIVSDAFAGLKFDLEKLFGWKGGLFVISGIDRAGEDLTRKYVGSIYSVQQMVGGQRPFLYQVYLQQKLAHNKVRLDIRNVLFDTRFSAYPFPVWAAAAFYESTEFNVKLGLFQTSNRMFDNTKHGLDWSIRGEDGYTAIAQFGWTPQLFKQPVTSGASDGKGTAAPVLKGMPGHYHIGVTFSQWDFYPRFLGGFEDHSYGFYVHADQMVYQEAPGSDQGLCVFVASGYYPQSEISIVPFQVNVGLHYKGLFPGRDDDRTILHFIYGDLSDDYARSVHVPGRHFADSEKVLEVGHRFQVTKWSYIQPDLQYVIDPGGTGDIPDAVVIGAQMGVTF